MPLLFCFSLFYPFCFHHIFCHLLLSSFTVVLFICRSSPTPGAAKDHWTAGLWGRGVSEKGPDSQWPPPRPAAVPRGRCLRESPPSSPPPLCPLGLAVTQFLLFRRQLRCFPRSLLSESHWNIPHYYYSWCCFSAFSICSYLRERPVVCCVFHLSKTGSQISCCIFCHLCIYIVCLPTCERRSPRLPGRGGRLFSRCLRTLSGRPGVSLLKRYYSQPSVCVFVCNNLEAEGATVIRSLKGQTIHASCWNNKSVSWKLMKEHRISRPLWDTCCK